MGALCNQPIRSEFTSGIFKLQVDQFEMMHRIKNEKQKIKNPTLYLYKVNIISKYEKCLLLFEWKNNF